MNTAPTPPTPPLLLLDEDATREVFKHVELPFALKLTCRAMRAAAPGKTKTSMADVVGTVSLLAWARELGCPYNEETCMYAAAGGHLEVLRWAHEHLYPWDRWTCAFAAHNGHIDCLKYAYEQGCDLDKRTCEKAAAGGQLSCLATAGEKEAPWDVDT